MPGVQALMGLPPDQVAALNAETESDDERQRKALASKRARRAQAAGAKHEADVERACGVYLRRRLARVEKRNPGVRFGRGKRPIVLPGGEDFDGHLVGTGRRVCFEVKADAGASLDLTRYDGKGKPRRPTLTPMQRARLRAAWEDGCLVGVLVRLTVQRDGRKVARWFWLSWPGWLDAVGAAKAAGDASLSQDVLEAHGVECDTRAMHGAPDWLPAALRAARAWRKPPLNEEVLAAWLGVEVQR